MNVSLYSAASAMSANLRWQEMIADNLASSSTPGFKKQELTMKGVRPGAHTAAGAVGSAEPQFVLPQTLFWPTNATRGAESCYSTKSSSRRLR